MATSNARAAQIPTPTASLAQAVLSSSQIYRHPQESRLKNKSLDEITNQWADDVEKYKKEFQDSSSNIKKWDTILVEGRGKITRLVTESKEAERTQSVIDNALERLESEQLDMEKLFDYYETVLGGMEIESLGTRPTDVEREQMFDTIIKLSSKLTEMQTGAENLITSLNNMSLRVENSNTDGYFSSIVRILNQHLQIMQWINTQTAALSVKTVKARGKSRNLDTEGDETMRNLNARHRLRY
ncbi:FG-nucleoporin nsp1 [Maublancomyces gigas]|uniref:FG-nucleoporin nsp1 n=1 Tax=Discina gigas TaxID=1032678 RepID=A0ABR3GUG6_9PEZI